MSIIGNIAATLFMSFFIGTTAANSATLKIDESQSSFSRDFWYCYLDCNAEEQYQISGTFEVTFDFWLGTTRRILLTPMNVETNAPDIEPFELPKYPVVFENGAFSGNGNGCNFFIGPGTCYSQGNFGFLSGEFDGVNLRITGADAISYDESYHFTISATVVPSVSEAQPAIAVPLPRSASAILIMSMLLLGCLNGKKIIRSAHFGQTTV